MIEEKLSRVARSSEEILHLLQYCQAGKLRDVARWIEAGLPLEVPPFSGRGSRRSSPMEIAIEKGFYSLAELLVEGGAVANESLLSYAIASRQLDIAQLFLDHGISASGVSGHTAFSAGMDAVRLLMKYGFDPSEELAFYHALCSHVRPHLSLLKGYKDRFPELQRQAEMALAEHSLNGKLRNVCLLLWAGARANARVPSTTYITDPETLTTPLEAAAGAGQLEVLKKLKPERFPDILKGMMEEIWLHASQELTDYLLSLGAPLNNRPNGGSGLLEHLIGSLDSASQGLFDWPDAERIESLFRLIEHVVEHGAKWIPDADEDLRHQRSRLRRMKPEYLVRLFRTLKNGGGASVEFLDALLASPSFRRRLGSHLQEVEAILYQNSGSLPATLPTSNRRVTSGRRTLSKSSSPTHAAR